MSAERSGPTRQNAGLKLSPQIDKETSRLLFLAEQLVKVQADLKRIRCEFAEKTEELKRIHAEIDLALQGESTEPDEEICEDVSDDELFEVLHDAVWKGLDDLTSALPKTLI
ncbi:hypothetical protein EDC01DRAFT_630753 [Geopyxis carbonaria]|nr:hypothetical protein EDC01DRAFT_630753 [Geopyxis carbonaria]